MNCSINTSKEKCNVVTVFGTPIKKWGGGYCIQKFKFNYKEDYCRRSLPNSNCTKICSDHFITASAFERYYCVGSNEKICRA